MFALRLDYTYTAHNLPATINELAGGTSTGIVTFTYDNRGRLIHEVRTGTSAYNLAYEYDQGGNRTKKIDALASREWVYQYDVGDYATYGSDNNRLEFYQEFDTSGVGSVLAATTWYFYNESGNVTRVVTNPAGTSGYTADRLGYFSNGQAVEYLLGESWSWDGDPNNDPTGYAVSYARAFRYDGARQRYMNSVIDPLTMQTTSTTWSDYEGDEVYGDFTTTGGPTPTITETRSFELGLATTGDPLGSPTTEYYHPNLIGTTRQMSDGTGATTGPAVYTAFGEKISGTTHRYGYAGAWGYQTEDSSAPRSPFIHVGHRYYDPATGRFLQRDPIGIRGGTNVYAYVNSSPAGYVDPLGLEGGLDPWGKRGGINGGAGDYKDYPPHVAPPVSTEKELELIKKDVFGISGCSALGGILYWPWAAGVVISGLLDAILHPNEPVNPVFGGSYENWYK